MNKRRNIAIGIVALFFALFFYTLVMILAARYDTVPIIYILICVLCCSVFVCFAEVMFIRAKIVPKIIRFIIYFQWFAWGGAWVITFIWIIFGGSITHVTLL